MAEYDHWCLMNSNTLDEARPQQEEVNPKLITLLSLLAKNLEMTKAL